MEVDVFNDALPFYVAVMLFAPIGNAAVPKVAVPLTKLEVPRTAVPLLKVTVPVAVEGFTVAVNVTVAP